MQERVKGDSGQSDLILLRPKRVLQVDNRSIILYGLNVFVLRCPSFIFFPKPKWI